MSESVTERIASMPVEFHKRGNVSMTDLFVESGFLDSPNRTDSSSLAEYFRSNPELVDEWVQYFQDQRCSPAFYLMPPSKGSDAWVVSYTGTDGPFVEEQRYSDRSVACAEVVLAEVAQLESNHNGARY
jgi:hypothetical protein